MKVIVAGGRDFKRTKWGREVLDALHSEIEFTEVVCGMARGADTMGRYWAHDHHIPVKQFPAKWDKYGAAAGPIRNGQMAAYADVLIAFPGGKGTANMVKQAKQHGLIIYDFRNS